MTSLALTQALTSARLHLRTLENGAAQLGSKMYLEQPHPAKIDADAYLAAIWHLQDALDDVLAQINIITEEKS